MTNEDDIATNGGLMPNAYDPTANDIDYLTGVLTRLQRMHTVAPKDSPLAEIIDAAAEHIAFLVGYLLPDGPPV
jgi:hypothetical protein